MDIQLINRFFELLNEELGQSADIIVTGAAAGALMGHLRPSVDIDFEIKLHSKASDSATILVTAILKASRVAGIATQYSQDISRRSMIDLLDYRKRTVPYKKIGKLTVKLMAPEYWTIGKVHRYLKLDAEDIVAIIKRKKISFDQQIKVWAKALKSSELSMDSKLFRDHVCYFINEYGSKTWGRDFNAQEATQSFKSLIT